MARFPRPLVLVFLLAAMVAMFGCGAGRTSAPASANQFASTATPVQSSAPSNAASTQSFSGAGSPSTSSNSFKDTYLGPNEPTDTSSAGVSSSGINATPPGTMPPSTASSTFVFVENAGTAKQMAVLRLNADGSLKSVNGSPFPYDSASIAIAGNYVIAGNYYDIAAYSVDPTTGTLTKTSSDVQGGQLAATNEFVYAGNDNAIYEYQLVNGSLSPIPGEPFAIQPGPICDCAMPAYASLEIAQGHLFYADNAGHAGTSAYAATIQGDGSLLPNRIDVIGDGGSASIVVSPNGKFVYGIDESMHALSLWDFDGNTGAAQYVGLTTASNGGVIDPSGTFLFATPATGSSIDTYRINPQDGTLTEVASAVFTGYQTSPQAFDPTGKYLLSLDSPTATTYAIGVWAIDASSGSLRRVGSYSLGSTSDSFGPRGLVVGSFQ